jgi:hypothetical protein
MRYSRFKKQMDGTASVRRPRGPNSPRRAKVEKSSNKSPRKGKGKAKDEEDGEGRVKAEPEMGSSRQGTVESEGAGAEERRERRIKLEPGLGLGLASASHSEGQPTPRTMPNTPSSSRYVREASASPSPGPSERFEGGDMSEMDEMGFSFGMHGEEAMPGLYGGAPLMGEGLGGNEAFGGGFGMGMGMQMGLGDPFEGLWQGHGHPHGGHTGQGSSMHAGEGRVHVKTEPRWEEAYRHV